MTREKRKSIRKDSKLFVEISSEFGEHIGRGVVQDVSLGGLGIFSEVDLENGREVICQVEIPLKIKGKVVTRLSQGQMKRYGLIIKDQGFLEKLFFRMLLKGPLHSRKV
ncbi:MAG: PilZ domain-containing protein [Elusimicrobiota bacterium]